MGVPSFGRDDLRGAVMFRDSLDLATEAGYEPGRAAAMQAWAWSAGTGVIAAPAGSSPSLRVFRTLGESSELAPPMLDVGEFLVPEPETAGLRIVFQETFSSFLDVPCSTAVGYVLANLG